MSKASRNKPENPMRRDIPVGLGMALSMNVPAMENFAAMNAAQQDAILRSASRVSSKNEMQVLVKQIAEGTFTW